MATRVYVQSNDPAVLEIVAGVPAGTHAVYLAWKASVPADLRDEVGYDAWMASASDDVRSYHEFQLYGFGRLRHHATVATLESTGYVGSTTDPGLVAAILAAQADAGYPALPAGVTAGYVVANGGLYWC